MLTGPQNMPVFADSTLPTEDKQAIIAYIETLKTSRMIPAVGHWAGSDRSPRACSCGSVACCWSIACAIWIGAKVR